MNRFKTLRTGVKISIIIISILLLIAAVFGIRDYAGSSEHSLNLDSVMVTSLEDGSVLYSIGGISLPRGNYAVSVNYALGGQASLDFTPQNDIQWNTPLSESGGAVNSVQEAFTLDYPSDLGRIGVTVTPGSVFYFDSIIITSDKHIYSDGLIVAIVMIILLVVLWAFVLNVRDRDSLVKTIVLSLIAIITFLPILLSTDYLPVGGDIRAHLMRIDGLYFGIMDHQFPVVINPEWNNTYGQMGILYPSLFLYIPALFRLFGMSMLGTVKLSLGIVIVISLIVFKASAEVVFKKNWQILLTVILLNFENTRMYGVYFGGKLGGALLAEIFIPLAIAGIVSILYKDGSKWYYLAIGTAGVLCAHIISAVVLIMTLLIIVIIGILRLSNRQVLVNLARAVALCIGLIFRTYVGLFSYYFTDWSKDALTWRVFLDTLWRINDPFFDPRWTSPMILLTLCLILTAILGVRNSWHFKKTGTGNWVMPLFITALILFFLSSVYFPWAALRNIGAIKYLTDMLQSGNRFVGLSGEICAFSLPALIGSVICRTGDCEKVWYKQPALYLAAVTIISILGYNYIDSVSRYDSFGINIYDEIVADIEYEYEDYLPEGTLTEYYRSDSGYISDESIISSLEYNRRGTHVNYSYTATADGEYVEFPKFWYPGYKAYDENGTEVPILKGDRNRIRYMIGKTDNTKEVHIRYEVPKYITISYIISLAVWTVMFVFLLRRRCKVDKS